jgi:enterochelin esterase-like enzyme
MLEPQSTFLFVLLVLAFGGLIWWLVVTHRVALKIVAACLSFFVAFSFGVLAVNKYFAYYSTWGAAVADFTNASPNQGPEESAANLYSGSRTSASALAHEKFFLRLALTEGYTEGFKLDGPLSHIKRTAYIYFPPQYFMPAYKHHDFPVIELVHGQPGEPLDWINVVGVTEDMLNLINEGKAKPAVLVMPDANGGNTISLQCLNQVGGPQDLTYMALDVPEIVYHTFKRLQPPGLGWGVAGYSEGGYCAANMALRYRYRYGFSASLSGYFTPVDNKLPGKARPVSPFGNNRALQQENTPLWEVNHLAPGALLPQFWLGAGSGDRLDVENATLFQQELNLHEGNVPLDIYPGGGHTMGTWHAEVPPMLIWMTNGLYHEVLLLNRLAAKHHHISPIKPKPPAHSAKHRPKARSHV